MISRALDQNHDWTYGKGKNNYKRDKDALAQNIKTRLLSFVGDCFFALDEGIDWFNLLGSKNLGGLRLQISTCILATNGVTGIVEVSVTVGENRSVTITYNVDSIYGRVNGTVVTGA